MRFDILDAQMRVFETNSDQRVLPEMFMVARLDGRSFTNLTKRVCQFEKPFDPGFRDLMVYTAKSLMQCGFNVVYAYTESDEISLLLHRTETLFDRKLRKLNSVLAGQASAAFSLELGRAAVFDCRISQLPNRERVVDYFRWRSADALRNALNAHCYWALRKDGWSARRATNELANRTRSEKHELLFQQFGTNFNDVPTWQKQGVGLVWKKFEKPCVNRKTGEATKAQRRAIEVLESLPVGDEYSDWLRKLCVES